MKTTDVLDLIGAGLVVAFLAIVWWPLALLGAGVAVLAGSYMLARSGR